MTSTSTSRAPACSRPRWPGCSATRPLKAHTDNPTIARLWYTSINPTVKPFDNIDCRKAVEYAMDRTSYQTAYGGPFAGGEIATTMLPPQIPGYQKFDLYPTPDNKGDVEQGQGRALKACGQPNGFKTNISYRDRASEGEGDRRGVPAGAGQGRHRS